MSTTECSLTKIDFSWNIWNRKQSAELAQVMMDNVNNLKLEHVNLAMTALHADKSIAYLTRFIRRS